MSTNKIPIVIAGAGPAGLAAALKLARRGFAVTVVERGPSAGGNAGSFNLDGVNVDYGSHRLHPSCPAPVLRDIRSMLGNDLLDRPRHGRIRLRDRWLHFPLKPANILRHAPQGFLWGILRDSFAKNGKGGEETFASILQHGLGPTICNDFYFPYAEKIWGLDPAALDPEQARRRVAASSRTKLAAKVLKAASGKSTGPGSRFYYPRGGYGQIAEAYLKAAREAGAEVKLNTSLRAISVQDGRVAGLCVEHQGGSEFLETRLVLSTIPLPAMVRALQPSPPSGVLAAVESLQYRGMVLVYLVLETDRFTEFDAHYFPGREIGITRLSEPKNYGLAEAPGCTVLCAEIPCSTDSALWSATDDELGREVLKALVVADLPVTVPVRRVVVRRIPHAYPLYTTGYREAFDRLDGYAGQIGGLVTFGRQGLFAHDNTHHALAMGYALSDSISPEGCLVDDLWALHRRQFESHVVED